MNRWLRRRANAYLERVPFLRRGCVFDPALLDLPIFATVPRLTIRRGLLGLVWLLCVYVTWQRGYHAVHMFDRTDRPPSAIWGKGNCGHMQIDFGGQWLMGRMVATGQGKHLYDRNRHWKALREGYPAEHDPDFARLYSFPADERPVDTRDVLHNGENLRTDAENVMSWTMGTKHDSKRWGEAAEGIACAFAGGLDGNPFAVAATQEIARQQLCPELIDELNRPSTGGPLYPPIHAIFYAPLGCIRDAQTAYTVLQAVGIFACFLAGWAAQKLSYGRLAWPVCTALILMYPGFRPGLDLGQNHSISLAIVLVGWALVVRGRPYCGGAVWGLLAFKPVWGIVFVLVPLLMLRWRVVLAMGLVGCGLALATLPIVGLDSWFHWLENGKEATKTYETNKNWIELSRDLAGIPKRILIDFKQPDPEANLLASQAGWLLWVTVFLATGIIYCFQGNRRQSTGLGAGFLFLGAYHCCYRFMYYDVLLSAAAVLILFAHPALLFRTPRFHSGTEEPGPFQLRARVFACSIPLTIVALLLWNENGLMNIKPHATVAVDYFSVSKTTADGKVSEHMPTLSVTFDYFHPVDTVLLLLLWAWAGCRLLISGDYPRSKSSAAPMSAERISDSPTSTA